jgi:hypothetical protein
MSCLVACLLINEGEFVLVGKKGLVVVGRSSEMILEDVENQLINDPQLNLVAVDKPFVVVLITIKGGGLALRRVCLERGSQKNAIIPVEPLRELLTLGGRHFCPLRE